MNIKINKMSTQKIPDKSNFLEKFASIQSYLQGKVGNTDNTAYDNVIANTSVQDEPDIKEIENVDNITEDTSDKNELVIGEIESVNNIIADIPVEKEPDINIAGSIDNAIENTSAKNESDISQVGNVNIISEITSANNEPGIEEIEIRNNIIADDPVENELDIINIEEPANSASASIPFSQANEVPKCSKCGAIQIPGDMFCMECGNKHQTVLTEPGLNDIKSETDNSQPVILKCSKCGTPHQTGDSFCVNCGNKLCA